MILHTENPEEFTKRLLVLISEFRKGHKIYTQKSVVFIYTSNEESKNKIKKQVLLQTH